MLRYFRQSHEETERHEITYDEALNIVLGSWKDNDMTRDMLTVPNNITCMFSDIFVEQHNGGNDIRVLMAGLWNILPPDVEYDENGMHVK